MESSELYELWLNGCDVSGIDWPTADYETEKLRCNAPIDLSEYSVHIDDLARETSSVENTSPPDAVPDGPTGWLDELIQWPTRIPSVPLEDLGLTITQDVYAPAYPETASAPEYRIEQDVYGADIFPVPFKEELKMDFSDVAGLFTTALQGPLSTAIKGIAQGTASGIAADGIEGLFNTLMGGQTDPVVYRGGSMTVDAYACPRGKHIAKKGGKCVTNRSMNPLNPRALKRATSRISRFHHFAVTAEKQMAAAFRKGGFHPTKRVTSGGKCGTCRKTRCSC